MLIATGLLSKFVELVASKLIGKRLDLAMDEKRRPGLSEILRNRFDDEISVLRLPFGCEISEQAVNLPAVFDCDVCRVRYGFDLPVLRCRGQRRRRTQDREIVGTATVPEEHIRFALTGKSRAPGEAVKTWNVVVQ